MIGLPKSCCLPTLPDDVCTDLLFIQSTLTSPGCGQWRSQQNHNTYKLLSPCSITLGGRALLSRLTRQWMLLWTCERERVCAGQRRAEKIKPDCCESVGDRKTVKRKKCVFVCIDDPTLSSTVCACARTAALVLLTVGMQCD